MCSVLTLKFNSIMQSFGTCYSDDGHRITDNMPTKSQVIGMILNAMGHDYTNTDKESIYLPKTWSDKLRFGVCKYYSRDEYKLTDFCTAQRHNGDTDDLIKKEYMINSRYDVFLEGDAKDLEEIESYLFFSKNSYFIGKRCCMINDYIFWDNNKNEPNISYDTTIEEKLFKSVKDTNRCPENLIECENLINYINRSLPEKTTELLNSLLDKGSYIPCFFIKEKTNPIRFGKHRKYKDLFCYSVEYLGKSKVNEND